MSNLRFVFRNLPGIADVQALLEKIYEHPNPEWAPEQDLLKPLVDKVSKDLFGITRKETDFVDENFDDSGWAGRQLKWEQNFYFTEHYFGQDPDPDKDDEQELVIWGLLNWDVTDGDGNIHDCLGEFDRQMICATKGLRGRMPDQPRSEHELVEIAEEWGKSLIRSVNRRS